MQYTALMDYDVVRKATNIIVALLKNNYGLCTKSDYAYHSAVLIIKPHVNRSHNASGVPLACIGVYDFFAQ